MRSAHHALTLGMLEGRAVKMVSVAADIYYYSIHNSRISIVSCWIISKSVNLTSFVDHGMLVQYHVLLLFSLNLHAYRISFSLLLRPINTFA